MTGVAGNAGQQTAAGIEPGFSGSYLPEDVTFLLRRVALAATPVAEKESAIQSGRAHYSEMISEERRPDARYLEIYADALDRGAARIAREVRQLAATLVQRLRQGRLAAPLTLCSLVRAGVPYGVLLRRALADLGVEAAHFGVSIIRDRGLDAAAMSHILACRPAAGIVFVDGWTGKGAIADELDRAWQAIAGRPPVLAVLADPCGRAEISGSHEDWLIPSGILGANVSGLISRSILNARVVGPGQFHACVGVDHLADIDRSRPYVDRISAIPCPPQPAREADPAERARLRAQAQAAVSAIRARFGVDNPNRVKPGIAEATRAVLRRRPERVFVRDEGDPDVAALLHLCRADAIPTEADPAAAGPYRAITLIAKVGP